MQKIKYSRVRLSVCLALLALFVWGGIWMMQTFDGKGAFMGGLAVLVMGCLMPIVLRYLLLDNTIAEIGRHEMVHHGLLGKKRIRYDQVTDVAIETQTTNGIFTSRHLLIQGTFGKVRISERLLDRKAGSIDKILDLIANGPESEAKQARPARRLEPEAPAPTATAPHGGGRARTFGRKAV